jgi:ketosteroid isomerase-like protein
MGTQANKQLLERIYAGLSQGRTELLFDSLDENAQWTIIGSTPLSGTFHGKREIMDVLITPLRAQLASRIAFSVERVIAEDEHVVLLMRGQATSVTGAPYNQTYCIVARIIGDRIVEMTDYVDTELVTQALFAGAH